MAIKQIQNLLRVLIMGLLLWLPLVSKAAQFDYDLGIRAEDINFASQKFITGQKMRVYVTVYNFGNKDSMGFVSIYQGAELLGESQPISLKATGFADEVFIDFIVPAGSFNLMAAIRGTAPQDQNILNNEAMTPLITPIADGDGDGVPDTNDNCKAVANADQKNNDGDVLGDICDDDDDNDGIPDAQENAMGTNSMNPDSDGDGLIDSKDKSPLKFDPSKLAEAPVKTVKPIEPAPKPATVKKEQAEAAPVVPASQASNKDSAKNTSQASIGNQEEKSSVQKGGKREFNLPLKIVTANFEKRGWGNYAFLAEAMGGIGEYQYEWWFGDGKTAQGQNVIHKFKKPDDYLVKLTIKSGANQEVKTELPISFSFWSMANPKFWILLGFLVAMTGALIVMSWKPKDGNE